MEDKKDEGTQPEKTDDFAKSRINLEELTASINHAKVEAKKYLIGQNEMVDLMLIGMLSDGHILLEGVPGIAKTLTAKIIAKTLNVDFARIQFTPDMMPSDIIGTSVYNMKDSEFKYVKGPVFSNIVLIDEINRAPAKTQAALFEVMEERQVTFEGTTHKMSFPFLVIATQNPVEQEGTYRLPEAQLDRFLFRVILDYPSVQEEEMILQRYKGEIKSPDLNEVKPVFKAEDIKKFQEIIKQVRIEDQLVRYIAQVVHESRNHAKLYLGASPRASLAILKASKALAAIRGRDFVVPDDIQYIAPHVMNHRIILSPEAEMEGLNPQEVIKEIMHSVEVPR